MRGVVDVLCSGCVTHADWLSYIDLRGSIEACSYTVRLPKWKTKTEMCLDKTMVRVGATLDNNSTTSQFCAVEVDEEGCVAMAVTRTSGLFSFRPRTKFYIDKPFIWLITRAHPNGVGRTILFMGLIIDPRVV